jgi:hypothetical protein
MKGNEGSYDSESAINQSFGRECEKLLAEDGVLGD